MSGQILLRLAKRKMPGNELEPQNHGPVQASKHNRHQPYVTWAASESMTASSSEVDKFIFFDRWASTCGFAKSEIPTMAARKGSDKCLATKLHHNQSDHGNTIENSVRCRWPRHTGSFLGNRKYARVRRCCFLEREDRTRFLNLRRRQATSSSIACWHSTKSFARCTSGVANSTNPPGRCHSDG